MSQEKVDRYKDEKANRAKILKKQKRQRFFVKLGGSLAALVLVAWVGYSGYKQFYKEVSNTYTIDTAAVDDYLNNMSAVEAEETEAVEETEAADTDAAETEAETGAETEAGETQAEEEDTEVPETE